MDTLSLHDYHLQFIQDLKAKGRAGATAIAYGKDLEQFIQFLHEQKPALRASEIVSEDIEKFKSKLIATNYTDKSVYRKINSIKSFFRFLRSSGVIEDNPAGRITHPKYLLSEPRILTKLEYRALRDACKIDKRISTIVEILLQTGMRISELASLEMSDLDEQNQSLHIRALESHPPRIVPLNNAALTAINQYLEIRPKTKQKTLFVTKTCRPFLVRNIRTAIDRYFRLSGISDAKVNDLRHTFIVEQLAAGTPLVYVSQLVGHKRLTTTEKYLKLLERSDVDVRHVEEL